jgi:hypothetical protein
MEREGERVGLLRRVYHGGGPLKLWKAQHTDQLLTHILIFLVYCIFISVHSCCFILLRILNNPHRHCNIGKSSPNEHHELVRAQSPVRATQGRLAGIYEILESRYVSLDYLSIALY